MTGDIRMEDVFICFPVRDGFVRAADGVSVTFHSGEITGIIGESGCGKSVLGMAMLGLLPAYAQVSGRIWFGDRELLALKPQAMRKIRGRGLGLIAQNPADSLNPVRRIRGQIVEAMRLSGSHRSVAGSCPEPADTTTALHLLTEFGFSETEAGRVLCSYPFQLSGGMQQRTVTAMGVASGADWILADEPSKGLDQSLREQMYTGLRQVKDRGTEGMIIITHDIALADTLCDSVAVMYSGQIIEKGRHVLKSPRHPYTQGLLDSLPSRGMHPMKGSAPAPGEILHGCKFAPRCGYAKTRCFTETPQEARDGSEIVRCFLYD